ncbi:hypothetical protein [Acinetobacter sp. WZC-1]|uniref:hypothetical protein n=1 Tax=Acinetobacter sp. WZC-1 TaxID=3459034 RepID=UPI00403D80F4
MNTNFLSAATPVQLAQLCPPNSSVATCLNQLRHAHISHLNLGNLIICPDFNCLIIFKEKLLIRIETLTSRHSGLFADN